MKASILFFVILFFLFSPAHAQFIKIPSSSKPLIESDAPFGATSTIRLERVRDTNDKEVTIKAESGLINGVAYRFFYSDGSGSFVGKKGNQLDNPAHWDSHWQVGCDKDAMSDHATCYMRRRDLMIVLTATGKALLSIGDDHYPGSDVMIRIDNARPFVMSTRVFKGGFNFVDSGHLIKQITTAKTITTRYKKWPEGVNQDDVWAEVFGFNEALQYLKWAVARIK